MGFSPESRNSRHRVHDGRLSAQLVEQRLRVLEIGGIELFGDPAPFHPPLETRLSSVNASPIAGVGSTMRSTSMNPARLVVARCATQFQALASSDQTAQKVSAIAAVFAASCSGLIPQLGGKISMELARCHSGSIRSRT